MISGVRTDEVRNFAPKDKGHILLVNLNKSYDSEKAKIGRVDLYEMTRKYWRMSKANAEKIRYVLGVYRGIVRTVLKVEGHEWAEANVQTGEVFTRERCCFEGELDNGSPYMNTDVSDYPFGSGAAIRYIPADSENDNEIYTEGYRTYEEGRLAAERDFYNALEQLAKSGSGKISKSDIEALFPKFPGKQQTGQGLDSGQQNNQQSDIPRITMGGWPADSMSMTGIHTISKEVGRMLLRASSYSDDEI